MATLQSVFNNISTKKQEFVFNKFNFIIFEKVDTDKVKRIHIIQKETKYEMFFTVLNQKELETILNGMIESVKSLAGTKFLTLSNHPNSDFNTILKLLFK